MFAMVMTAEELSDAERKVWDAFPSGALVSFLTGNKENDYPAGGKHWGDRRQVRAEVLLELLCGAVAVEPGQAGAVNLQGARITGAMNLREATFKHALLLDSCYIGDGIGLPEAETESVELRNCHTGPIDVLNAKIGGAFVLTGSRLNGNDGAALAADGLIVTGPMLCDEITADGPISLAYASIRGALGLSGAQLDSKDGGAALALDRASAADVNAASIVVCGKVSLIGAQIAGGVNMAGARLHNRPGAIAVDAEGASIGAALDLQNAHVIGETTMRSGRVGGRIFLEGARLENPAKTALRLSRTTVGSDVFCQGMTAKGRVKLTGAQIGSVLNLTGTRLEIGDAPEGADDTSGEAQPDTKVALDLEDLQAAEIRLLPAEPIKGAVLLSNARVHTLRDKPDCWPEELKLDGLAYDSLAPPRAGEPPPKVEERLGWLARNGYHPQPYEQLAAYYRRQGEDRQARRVLLAKERARRKQYRIFKRREWLHNSLLKGWGYLQDGLAGYGYAPGRALSWLAAAFVIGWLVFSRHHPAPVNAAHPVFNAALYTLDLLVPAPGLGQASDWNPHGVYLVLAAGLHILGWLLAITVIAAITRLFSRS